MTERDRPPLIRALTSPDAYPHPVRQVRLLETHISWVLLTGDYVYKLKKPVDLGFVDFTALSDRHHYCEEELRLNRRLAPELYLDVVTITGSAEAPVLNGDGEAIEYAVRMREFDQSQRLDHVAERGELEPEHIDELAHLIAAFHERLPPLAADAELGEPEIVRRWALDNLELLRARRSGRAERVAGLEQWTRERFQALRPELARRKREGAVRECHGDMHLGNMALIDGRVTVFDCIEFNPELRWIDVMSELAFVVMDLYDRDSPRYAARLLNRYLSERGDYDGLRVLRWLMTYRALVRAKVSALQLARDASSEDALAVACRNYVDLAAALAFAELPWAREPWLAITCGLSGSGKSTLAGYLVEALGAVQVRSDVERKRLHGLAATERSGSALDAGLYTQAATERTYERLAEAVRAGIAGRFSMLVDATFIDSARRKQFAALAAELGVSFVILWLDMPADVLRQRVERRSTTPAADASEAGARVLEDQLRHWQPPTPEEGDVVRIGPDTPVEQVVAEMRRATQQAPRA